MTDEKGKETKVNDTKATNEVKATPEANNTTNQANTIDKKVKDVKVTNAKKITVADDRTMADDIFESFGLIFKYAFLTLNTVFSFIFKPLAGIFAKTSSQVDKVYQTTKNAMDTKAENPSALAKLWKMLNSDMGEPKTVSGKKLEKIEEQKNLLQEALKNENVDTDNVKGKMYVYKALTPNKKIVSGRLYGFSKLDINSYLLNEGNEPISIENNKWIDLLYGQKSLLKSKFSNKDVIFFLTQLSTYIRAGITLTESMKIIMNQSTGNKSKLGIYQSIVYELTMGAAFSEAMEKQGNIFPQLLINMLKAAEATGELEETLEDMIDYYTDIETTRKDMVSAMTYPAIVTLFALGVVGFILLYVIPQFSDIYKSMNVELTGLTLTLLNLSDYLKANGLRIFLTVIAIIILIIFMFKRVKSFRRYMQIFLMHMPVIGNIIIYNEMTIFSKTFSSLLKNNVQITESIDILSKITNNEIYKEIMINTVNNIAAGDKISEAFKDQWAVPDVAYYMIVTGESTGQLAEMMSTVAHHFQEQHRTIIGTLKSLIEPIMIVSLAGVVGLIVISILIPMFNMYDSLSLGG